MTVYAAPGAAGAKIVYKPRYDNFIGGKFVAPVKGQYFDVISPVNGKVYTQAARSTAEDIDKALDAAITNLSSRVIENLLNKPWRAYIIGYEEDSVIISGGKSQNIAPGNIFIVYVEGKKVRNPQTNMTITLPGKRIATIKVVTCAGDTPENEVSLCEVVDGREAIAPYLKTKDFSNLYIGETP
mgnify:CR=1 FL=1